MTTEAVPSESQFRLGLRRYLPIWWMVGLAALVCLDAQRVPRNQVLGQLYVVMVEQYQRFGRPVLEGHIACRFQPTCSVYSIEAVERYGWWRGLQLTVDRLARCRTSVPPGSADVVP